MRHPLLCALGLLMASTTVHAALEARDLNGTPATAEAYYDTVLGITWLADANYFQTSGADPDGLADYVTLRTWAENLVLGPGGIYQSWRLPQALPSNGRGWNYDYISYDGVSSDMGYNHSASTNELGYMFYVNLGNAGARSTSGAVTSCDPNRCLTNTGPFVNLMPDQYYMQQLSWLVPYFRLYDGGYFPHPNGGTEMRGWVVHDGDIGVAVVVPEPGTWALMLAGVAALSSVARRRR